MINPNVFKPQSTANIFRARNDWALVSLKAKKFEVSLYEIMLDICKREQIKKEAFVSNTRRREIVEARQLFFKRSREITRYSLQTIGDFVGRDHATVLYGVKTVDNVRELTEKYNAYFKGDHTKKILLKERCN